MSYATGLAAAIALWSVHPVAVPPGAAVPGGIYHVATSQGNDAGELRIARAQPRMRNGSAFFVEWNCRRPGIGALNQEADLTGARIDRFGRFHVDSDNSPDSVMHVDGQFVSRRLARGTVWGYAALTRNTICRVRQDRPVTFRADYVGQTPR